MKYMGSKDRFAKELLPIILKDRKPEQYYVELFGGGMNMIQHVQNPRIVNEINPYVMAMFKALTDGWIPPKFVSKELYELCRQGKCEDFLKGYVGFNCSYSGKWFGGYAGIVMTRLGLRNYQDEAFRNIMKQVPKLGGIIPYCGDYRNVIIPNNSIVYCDPPYEGTTKYKDDFNHVQFWEYCRFLSNQGHKVFISEYNAPDDFKCIWSKEAKSSLSANGKVGGNKVSIEKLFIYSKD
jgi:DNA adenine methylase